MTFFGALRDNPLFLLFTLLSAAYFFSGLRLAQSLWQRRKEFTANPLQPWKKAWSERAAFLLGVPPGVFVHELFHALAIWAFGGTVTDVGYGFYWGYVSAPDIFTAPQNWFISLSGTLGTLLYGVVFWLFLRRSKSQAWRYFGLRTLRFQLYYALLYYPLFTLFTFIGDWRTIYNFSATPLLSRITLALHAASLLFFWWSDRRGWYEMPAFQSEADQQHLAALQTTADGAPHDARAQLQLIETLRRKGAANEARRRLQEFLKQHPRSAEGRLIMAYLEAEGKNQLPRAVRAQAEQALQLGLPEPNARANAHALLGQYYLQTEKYDDALRHFNDALAHASAAAGPTSAQLYYLRALTQRRRGAYEAASQDIENAIQHAAGPGHERLRSQLESERQTIAHHRRRR